MSFVTINPATGRRLTTHREDKVLAVERAVARAHSAQKTWARLGVTKRAAFLRRLGRALLAQRDELAALTTRETGKPITQARAEVEKCALLASRSIAPSAGAAPRSETESKVGASTARRRARKGKFNTRES